MRKFYCAVLVALFMAAVLAPSLYLLQFQLNKAYIIRELCVQRDVIESMRTCHGECQLSKKFRALEQEAEAGFPSDRLEIRNEPMVPHRVSAPTFVRTAMQRDLPTWVSPISPGHAAVAEPVPWC